MPEAHAPPLGFGRARPPGPERGLAALCARDPILAAIEHQSGPLPWRRSARGFPGLLQAMCGQQISNQAAAAIWRRLAALPGATTAEGLARLPDAALRDAGLSRRKITHARALAAAFAEGRLSDAGLAAMDDEAAIAAIARVPGFGRWSGEIYLLFALEREDVFPAGDLALAAAAAALYGLPTRPREAALRTFADIWRPWRSLAARLLWHHWRFVTGRPSMDDLPPT